MKNKIENRGGANRGQGRKSPFKEKTGSFKVTCPISKVDELKKYVTVKLLKWAKSGI